MTVHSMATKSTETKKPLFKSGEIVYYRDGDKFSKAIVYTDQASRMAKKLWLYNENDRAIRFSALVWQVYRPDEYQAIESEPVKALYQKGEELLLTEDGGTCTVKCERGQISENSDRLYVSGYHTENTWVDIAKLSRVAAPVAEVAEEVVAEVAEVAAAPVAEVAEEVVAEVAEVAEVAAAPVAEVAEVAEVAAPPATKKLFQKGDRVYTEIAGEYHPATVTLGQRHSKAKKIEILQHGRKKDVFVKDLITVAKYQEITGNTTPIDVTVADAPARLFQANDWLNWQARPGDFRIVQCETSQRRGEEIVWVAELKGNWRDRFGVKDNLLTLITDPAKIAELEANKTAIEARVDEMRLQDGLEAKAASEQAYLDSFKTAEDDIAEDDIAEGAVAEGDIAEDAVAEGDIAEDAVAEDDIAEGDIAEGAVAEDAVADATAVAGPPECYPDGVARASTVGRMRAATEREVVHFWQQDQDLYWRVGVGDARRGRVEETQRSPKSKKIKISTLDQKTKTHYSDPFWVLKSELMTPAEYQVWSKLNHKLGDPLPVVAQSEETQAEDSPAIFKTPQDFAKQLLDAGNNAGAISRVCDRLLALPMFDPTRIADRTKMVRLGPYSKAEGDIAEDAVAEGDIAEDAVAEDDIAEGDIAEGAVAEGDIADATAVAGPPECYPDGVARASTVGRMRAAAEREVVHFWQQDQDLYWRVGVGDARRGRVEETQRSANSKKIKISLLDQETKTHYGDPFRALKSELMTPAEYQIWSKLNHKLGDPVPTTAQDDQTPAEGEAVAFTDPQSFAKQVLAAGNNAGAISRVCDRLLALPMFDPARINERTKMVRLGPYSKAVEAEIKARGFVLERHTNAVIWRKKDGSEQLRHYYYKLVGLIDYDWDADNKKAAEKVIAKLDNQASNISSAQYIETTKYLLLKSDATSIYGGLIAATGRRIIELIALGTFTEIEGKTDQVMFSGQAKKRDKPSDPYSIYLLGCTVKQFLAKLDFARNSGTTQEAKKGLDQDDPKYYEKLSDRIRVEVNRKAIGPAFDWLPPREGEARPTSKTLRSVWAAVATAKYCPPETSPLLFTSRLLGHFVEGSVTSLADTINYIDSVAAKSEPSLAKVSDSVDDTETSSEAQSPLETAIEYAVEKLGGVEDETTPALDYVQFVEAEAGDRHNLDFYESPVWASLAMLEHGGIEGTIGECCNGYGSISRVFSKAGYTIWTNDIDPEKPADYHVDATVAEYWESLPDADWIISNPPYGDLSSPIVINAFKKAKKGVAFVLKMGWWELCKDRKQFLKDHPPTGFINLPRYCYRKGTITQKWATDEAPTVIYIWDKSKTHGLTQMIPLPAEDLRLFYRNPDQTPALDKIEAEIADIMTKKSQSVEAVKVEAVEVKALPPSEIKVEAVEVEATVAAEPIKVEAKPRAPRKSKEVKPKKPRLTLEEKLEIVSQKMEVFLKKNAQLPKPDRWFVSQNIIAKVAQVGNDLANEWLHQHKAELSAYNEGLNRSEQNRNRVFTGLD